MNTTLSSPDLGRLFAVVHIAGHQRKVTTEDVVTILGDFYPDVGDRIRLEKVYIDDEYLFKICLY